jgi:AcrR family transcriptional regulator
VPRTGRSGRYHHGDLRAALIDTAIGLIAERGVHGFSLAETSRRLGVAVSAPYAHFADRDELLAAIAAHAYRLFHIELTAEVDRFDEPVERLAALARAYVRFAAAHQPLFEVVFRAGLDKSRHPEMEAVAAPVSEAFDAVVRAVPGGEGVPADGLASAVEASAHGHAMLLLHGDFGTGDEAVALAADRAALSARALAAGRHLVDGGVQQANPDSEPS